MLATRPKCPSFLPGDLVEVRGRDEILATLDRNGTLDQVPFMPEMLQYCGKRFRIYKRAHKTCDNIKSWNMRRLEGTVLLEGIRCDGDSHGGCQAACMIFWKEAWLKTPGAPISDSSIGNGCTIDRLFHLARSSQNSNAVEPEPVYSCQATDLRRFTSDLPWWDIRQYIQDLRSGNMSTGLAGNLISDRCIEATLSALTILRAIVVYGFNLIQKRRRSSPYPHIVGSDSRVSSTPPLSLQSGEFVQIKSKEEILKTLNAINRHRGLQFEGEMLPYCGTIRRVRHRVERIIDEKTGRMLQMKSPCIVLDEVFCRGDYHLCCPRAIYSYWREEWLIRAQADTVDEQCHRADACRA